MPDTPETLRLAVVGARLTGMSLNHELTERAAVFVEATRTSGTYRLYALAGAIDSTGFGGWRAYRTAEAAR